MLIPDFLHSYFDLAVLTGIVQTALMLLLLVSALSIFKNPD